MDSLATQARLIAGSRDLKVVKCRRGGIVVSDSQREVSDSLSSDFAVERESDELSILRRGRHGDDVGNEGTGSLKDALGSPYAVVLLPVSAGIESTRSLR